MSPRITQRGRDTASKGRKVEKSVSSPAFALSATHKGPSEFSRSDLIDKHSSGRGASENPRSILKRGRRVTVATQNPAVQNKGGLSSEKRAKEKMSKPRKPISPDLLDLTNEDVVRDVLLRLYDSLGIADEGERELGRCASAARLCNYHNTTVKSAVSNSTQSGKLDPASSRLSMSLPQLRCPSVSYEVFYTPPASSQTVRPFRATPGPSAFRSSSVTTNPYEGRESFTNLFPTLNSCTPSSSGKMSICSETNTRSAVAIPSIVKQDLGVRSRTSDGLFSRKSRAERYSVTFA